MDRPGVPCYDPQVRERTGQRTHENGGRGVEDGRRVASSHVDCLAGQETVRPSLMIFVLTLAALLCHPWAALAQPPGEDSSPAPVASPAPLIASLVPPRTPVLRGDQVKIDLLVLNASEETVAFTPPAELLAVAEARGQSVAVTLQSNWVHAWTLAPGEGGIQSYQFSLPLSLRGKVILTLQPGFGEGASAVLEVRGSGAGDDVATQNPEPIQRAYLGRFAAHESVYFIYGGKAPGAKFQVSLKYRILTLAPAGSALPRYLQFGYTQRSLWDITADSSPFYDTSYMPALFFESVPRTLQNEPWRFSWLGYQFGYAHESNGRDGSTGRSLNTLWARMGVGFTLPGDWNILVSPQLFAYVFSLTDNPDVGDYRKYGRLHAAIGRTGGPSLFYTGQVGEDFKHPTHQLALTVPARIPVLDFLAILMAQYFHGYGESLLGYDEETDMLRGGFALVR